MKSQINRIVSLIIVLTMMITTLAGCITIQQPSDQTQNNNENQNGGNTEDQPSEMPNVCSHNNIVTDPAVVPTYDSTGLTEGSHCGICGNVIVKQEVIPTLQAGYYSLTFNNLKGAATPSINRYLETEGLSVTQMPTPKVEGYEFLGWFTASVGGELVDYIPAGSNKNYVLFAHWELINYEITYKNVPNNTNPTTYNIESNIKLETPKWSGLVFTNWTDSDGNVYTPKDNITDLPEKMSGDLVLTANWKVLRNIATPASNGDTLYNTYSAEEGFVYFFYDLGTIEHVVLDNIDPNLYYKSEGMPLNLTLSKTVTVSEDTAKVISNTVSQSISTSTSWEHTTNWAKEHSEGWSAQIGGGIEGGIGGTEGLFKIGLTAKLKVEGFYNWGKQDNTTYGWTHSDSETVDKGEEISNSISTSIAYKQEISSEIQENYAISENLPSGYYAYVHAGNVRVIAVISYEIATGCVYLNTYSRLDNMHSMIMYYSDVNQLNNPNVEELDFNISENNEIGSFIESIIKNSYYVNYDANGGEGETLTTMHSIDGTEKLATNTFTRMGYTFVSWMLSDDTGIKYQDGQSITNIGKPLKTVTLKALWRPNVYSVSYKSHSGMGLMENSTHTYDEKSILNSNVFYKTGYHFTGWNTQPDGSGTAYTDGQEIINLTHIEETITLFAQWEANSYTVKYHANGGSGSMSDSIHTYDVLQNLSSNTFTRTGWTFLGWSLDPSGATTYNNNQSVSNLTDTEDGVVKLYAIWKLETNYSTTFYCYDTVTDDYIYYVKFGIYDVFDMNTIKNKYNNAVLTVSFNLIEKDKGYQLFAASTGNSYESRQNIISQKTLETAGTDLGSESFTFTGTISSSNVGNYIFTLFSGSGQGEDDFVVNNVTITIEFY